MKIYWSAFLSLTLLLVLAGCGAEQFGTTPQSQSNPVTAPETFQQTSCAGKTLVKPEVDILYVVDNSTSSFYIPADIQNAIKNTVNSISTQFNYRVIGTPLLATANGNQEYQVLSESALPSSVPASKKISSPSQFSFFSNPVSGQTEAGLGRVQSFIAEHENVLFRHGAYLFIVLVSNGRDTEVEIRPNINLPTQVTSAFADRKAAFGVLKQALGSQQFRLFSVTADAECVIGGERTISSEKSYGDMSKALYEASNLPYQSARPDHYDICGSSIGTVFARVNAEIQQEIIPHTYQYAVATNTNSAIDTQPGRILVQKVSNGVATQMTSGWTYVDNSSNSPIETRVNPVSPFNSIPGEPTTARHLIKFNSSNFITYPDCVAVTALSNLEYFGYVVLPKVPKLESVILKVNGFMIPQSSSNGWSYIGQQTRNIKVSHAGYSDQPPATRTGYMLQLNGSNNYYRSGDNVTIDYIPASN